MVTKVALDVQLYPKERRLMVTGRYDLQQDQRPDPRRPCPPGRPRRRIAEARFLRRAAGLQRHQFAYRIYRFDTPLAPGATTT